MMRILMVSHGYPPVISGVTLVVQKLARAMVCRGHQVTVVTASDRNKSYRDTDQGVQLERVHALSNPFWQDGPIPIADQSELTRIAEALQPDVLHVHDAALLGIQALRLNRKAGIPLVATCYYVPRFVAHYVTWDGNPHKAIESLAWSYSTWLFNQFDHVVFATQAHRRAFQEQGLTAPTSIISNGLDIQRYTPGPADLDMAAKYDLPPAPRILFVSRLAQDKRIEVLLYALRRVCEKQEASLVLVGKGDDRERLESITTELGLEQRVRFTGFVPEADLPALYRLADCFAIASTCEVQSLPTLQAVATGLPVVAVDAMALPELVRHDESGYLVPPEDPEALAHALLNVLTDPVRAARMGRVGLEIAQAHDERRTFAAYEQLYSSMIGNRVADTGWHPSHYPTWQQPDSTRDRSA